MKEEYTRKIAAALQAVPPGSFEVRRHDTAGSPIPSPVEYLTAQTKGKGRIERFAVFPGLEVSFHQYLAQQVEFHHRADPHVLEINHCHRGRIGWNMRGGAAVYLGAGDLCLHSLSCCADSDMALPLGCYEGIAVTADLKRLEESPPALLREAGFDAKEIYRKFCAGGKPVGVPRSRETDALFSALYGLPENLRLPYCKLKALEVLLYLQQKQQGEERELAQYGSRQAEQVKEIHDFLVRHLDRRFTIEELAKKYLINTSSLKSVFKAVYGMPIASYVKEYRIQQAMALLRETDDSIACIAGKVGYESQGKFTKAFKESVGLLPTEYRRRALHPSSGPDV